jgi:hypothetical protein
MSTVLSYARDKGKGKEIAMDTRGTRPIGLATAVALAATLILGAVTMGPASAATVKVTKGRCGGASTWKLTLKFDAGRVESDAEVQTPTAGQGWAFRMIDNGVRFGSGNKTTIADGSWSATRLAANRVGTDHIRVRARNTVTGETCVLRGAL